MIACSDERIGNIAAGILSELDSKWYTIKYWGTLKLVKRVNSNILNNFLKKLLLIETTIIQFYFYRWVDHVPFEFMFM